MKSKECIKKKEICSEKNISQEKQSNRIQKQKREFEDTINVMP